MRRNKTWRQLLSHNRYWLALGLGIKRWLVLLLLGAIIAGIGISYITLVLHREDALPQFFYEVLSIGKLPIYARALLLILLGVTAVAIALWRLIVNIIAPFRPTDSSVAETIYNYSKQGRGPHIVAIGGGTGLPSLLRGLTDYTRNITAIITVADDGGSSGRLREELGVLPPGDFRNNLAALSRDETLMTQLLQYRFGSNLTEKNSVLQGHALGNLILAALMGITGSFDEALLAAERVLALRGRVLPSTLEAVTLAANITIMNGTQPKTTQVIGESAIPKAGGHINRINLIPPQAKAYPPALRAIFQADLIVLGPGSLYTSILPNLLIPDLMAALQHTQAKKVYICNVATQPGETDNYTVADHVATIIQHTSAKCVNIVLANNNLAVHPVDDSIALVSPISSNDISLFGDIQIITADLIDESKPWQHDSSKLAQAVMHLLRKP